jgi:hypothetical protein
MNVWQAGDRKGIFYFAERSCVENQPQHSQRATAEALRAAVFRIQPALRYQLNESAAQVAE